MPATAASFVAPALYLITDRRATGGRSLTEVVAAALRGAGRFRGPGGRLPLAVSLREKDLPARELADLAREIGQLTRAAGADLFINGRLDLALACGAQGVHLPGDGFVPEQVRALAPHLRVGVSTHTAEEARAAGEAGADFVVFGPVFAPLSKPGFLAPQGTEGLARAVAATAIPVLALGGVTPDRAGVCKTAGARGLACISALMRAEDPEVETAAFLARFLQQN
jgi:thiamine-phosphate pyrophosphorylase